MSRALGERHGYYGGRTATSCPARHLNGTVGTLANGASKGTLRTVPMSLRKASFLSQDRELEHSLLKSCPVSLHRGSFHGGGRWRKFATSCGCSAQNPQVKLPVRANVRHSLSYFQLDLHHVSLPMIRPVDLSLSLTLSRTHAVSLGPGAPSSPYFACSERASPCGYSNRHTDAMLQASDTRSVLCSAGSKRRAG